MTKPAPMPQGRVERVHIDKVVPYWRNPRRLNQEAVEAVRQSIENFGYAQPVVVDKEYVIIIGHTRYAALRRQGIEQVDVVVADHLTPHQVKQLRVIDNRAGEYAFWDFEKLIEEMGKQDSDLLNALFPEMAHHGEQEESEARRIAEAETEHESWERVDPEVEFVCPVCFHEWETEVTREQILSGVIKSK